MEQEDRFLFGQGWFPITHIVVQVCWHFFATNLPEDQSAKYIYLGILFSLAVAVAYIIVNDDTIGDQEPF